MDNLSLLHAAIASIVFQKILNGILLIISTLFKIFCKSITIPNMRENSGKKITIKKLINQFMIPKYENRTLDESFPDLAILYKYGIIIFYYNNSNNEYILYAFTKKSYDFIHDEIFAINNKIKTRFVSNLGDDSRTVDGTLEPLQNPYEWQNNLCREIINYYEKNSRASVLISGKPGIGKTRLGDVLASKIKNTLHVISIVYKNVNLTEPGISVWSLEMDQSEDRPNIIIIDEYDDVIKYAEREKDQMGRIAIANSRASLLTFLDYINLLQHVIIIFTTNKSLSEFEEVYVRSGRIDIKYQEPL